MNNKYWSYFKRYITDPEYRFRVNIGFGLYNNVPDEKYLKKAFRYETGKTLCLENPKTFNEKLQWLKLYNRKSEYTTMVDKYEVKSYIANKVGPQYAVPTIGIWDSFDKINFDELPDKFVLKCTHDSGGLVICKDKKGFDIEKAKRKIEKCLRKNFYLYFREWPYKDVQPRIIAEELLPLNEENNLEYKLFCFNGKVKVVLVCKGEAHADGTGRRTNDFMTVDFTRIPVTILNGHSHPDPNKPENLTEMITIAEKLSQGIPHLRVDFYSVCNKLYVGELTFFHNSGFNKFEPEEYDLEWGTWISLPEKG